MKNIEDMTISEVMDLARKGLDALMVPGKNTPTAYFGDMTTDGHKNIPTLEIRITDGGPTCYLSPCRGICFRVSADKQGNANIESSGDFNMRSALEYLVCDDKFAIIQAMAVHAVAKFVLMFDAGMPEIRLDQNDDKFKRFIEESYKWIFGEDPYL